MLDHSNDHGLGDNGVAGQTLPECGEHQGKCSRCGVEIKQAPRKRYKGEARRKRKVISIKVPNDEQENGGQVWDELIENVRNSLRIEGLDGDRPVYYILVDALSDWLTD